MIALLALALALPPSEKPLPAREAAAAMTLPPGFKATLFAGEPDVVQPIAFTFDDRGRLWVCECVTYPNWIKDGSPGKDRILIFEDTDNDGQFDKRTVFIDNLYNLTSIEYGFGGVYVTCSPHLLFIPIKDDKPGKTQVLLDGFALDIRHNMVNGLKWGPDGWLYGLHGIISTSYVGTPGTPKEKRPPINCGVWRFHPVKKTYEVYAYGTTNPWGIDWDKDGEMFITNCVIDHAFHIVQGGRYQRMYGQDLNPHTYQLMKSPCDHIHWAGGAWQSSREGKGKHSEAGGGHAHVGCMIYLGDNFPAAYRNTLFTLNLHGNRINNDILERTDAGYAIRHGRDFLFANDPWFRGLAITYGPDGGVYFSDWTDTGECHNHIVAEKGNGRIFKVTYGTPKHQAIDLAKLNNAELLKLFDHDNEWQSRHAQRLLQERLSQNPDNMIVAEVQKLALKNDSSSLRALWLLGSIGAMHELNAIVTASDFLTRADHYQGWTLQLLVDNNHLKPLEDHLLKRQLFNRNISPYLQMRIASVLLSIPVKWRHRDGIVRYVCATTLSQVIATDLNVSLMLWYAVEPELLSVPEAIPTFLLLCENPLIREFAARRILSDSDRKNLPILLDTLAFSICSSASQRDILRGTLTALTGVRNLEMPERWKKLYPVLAESPLQEVRDKALELALIFGDQRALVSIKTTVADTKLDEDRRKDALRTLVFHKPADLSATLRELLKEEPMRSAAIRGFASLQDDDIPALLLKLYPSLPAEEKEDVVNTLGSRPTFAQALLDAVEKKTVARNDLSSVMVRHLLALKDKKLVERVEQVWGTLRPASEEKAKLTVKYKKELTPVALKKADLSRGRALFAKNCSQCHKLFGEGSAIGPDLTGSQRFNLEYVLENVLDPSAVVARDYQVTVVTLDSGRTLSGVVKEETENALKLQTANELVVVSKAEIESRLLSKQSMMPDGMFEKLAADEVRDLVAYLASPVPVK